MVFCKLFGIFGNMKLWSDIIGFEGLYKCSTDEEILNVTTGKILKNYLGNTGYYVVNLYKEEKPYRKSIHRILMEAFVPNPNNLPCINHKDEDKTNNYLHVNDDGTIDLEKSNLEWCTHKYNCNYGTSPERIGAKNKIALTGKYNTKISKEPYQFTLDGVFLKKWPSTMEVERVLKIPNTHISACCLMKPYYKTAGTKEEHFKWSYKHKSTIQLDDAPCEYDATYCLIPT